MKYLDKYNEWMVTGLPDLGLCGSIGRNDKLLQLMLPEDSKATYWGHIWCANHPDRRQVPNYLDHDVHFGFTDLRQNIVLFMAAMNGEL